MAKKKPVKKRIAKTPMADLVPNNWLDPLLTGPDAVLRGNGNWCCPDIERLLNAIRKRIAEAEASRTDIRSEE